MTNAGKGLVAWTAVVVPIWGVMVLCTHWEPIFRDGWGHYIWLAEKGLSFDSVWQFAQENYHHNNPRFGQTLTLLLYAPGPWHSLITPIVELVLPYLLATLVLGRWPAPRRADDALLYATITAMLFAVTRSLGPMLFYRPFTGNYLYGLAINLAWLVPYRLHAEEPRMARAWWSPGMLVLGVAAGMCNEHTNPAFAAAGALALAVYWRRGERVVPWAWAGVVGLILGALALYLAPAQDLRYGGIAVQHSMLERIAERGASGNLRIVVGLVPHLALLLLWIALGVAARVRRASTPEPRSRALAELIALAMALAILVTLLASPKQGDRLYFAAIGLIVAAVAGWTVAQLGRIERWLAVVLSAAAIAAVSWRLLASYHVLHCEFQARLTALEHATRGTTVVVAPYSQRRSRYVLGDDFASASLRAAVAYFYGLTAIELDQRSPGRPPSDPDDP